MEYEDEINEKDGAILLNFAELQEKEWRLKLEMLEVEAKTTVEWAKRTEEKQILEQKLINAKIEYFKMLKENEISPTFED